MASCERLLAELQQVRLQEKQLQAQLKGQLRKLRRASLGEKLTVSSVSPKLRRRMLLFYSVSGCDPNAAVEILCRSRAPPPWQTWEQTARVNFLTELILATSVETLTEILDENGREANVIRQEAERLWAEFRTVSWTKDLNTRTAIAPQRTTVVEQHLSHLPAFDEARYRTQDAQRQWCSRWRRRWSGFLGKMKAGETDPPDIIREKVRGHRLMKPRFRTLSCFPGESILPEGAPQIGQSGVLKKGPSNLGPVSLLLLGRVMK